MDIALRQDITPNLEEKIKSTIALFKLSRVEQMLSDALEKMPDQNIINYVGELNKSDVMH